jgi:quercetin dioxygenase-like cupin family protein
LLSHLEPYLLMPSALTTTALLERAGQIASSAAVEDALRTLGNEPVRVRHTPLYDAWLVPWTPGASAALHAHDGAHGAVTAIRGELRETVTTGSGVQDRIVAAGEPAGYRPGDVHSLTAPGPAVTLHLSSPPRPVCPVVATPAALAMA